MIPSFFHIWIKTDDAYTVGELSKHDSVSLLSLLSKDLIQLFFHICFNVEFCVELSPWPAETLGK